MEELVNLIANDAAAAEISDGIKDVLFAKAASKALMRFGIMLLAFVAYPRWMSGIS